MNIYNIFLPLSEHFYLLIVCVKGYCCARSRSMKTRSEGLPWTRHRPVEETSTWQHTIITWYTHLCPWGIEPATPASERSQTHLSDRAVNGIRNLKRLVPELRRHYRTNSTAIQLWSAAPEQTLNGITWFFFQAHGSVHNNSMLIKIQPDATVCRYLFTAKSLYMFRVSQHTSSGVLKTVTATSGTGHNTGTATYLMVPIRSRWR